MKIKDKIKSWGRRMNTEKEYKRLRMVALLIMVIGTLGMMFGLILLNIARGTPII